MQDNASLRKKYLESSDFAEKTLLKNSIKIDIFLNYVLQPKKIEFQNSEEKLHKLFITYFLSFEYKNESEEVKAQKKLDYELFEIVHKKIENELQELNQILTEMKSDKTE